MALDKKFLQHGVFSWNELMTTDIKGAQAFYEKVFGWKYEEAEMPEIGTYATIKVGDTMLGGLMTKPAHLRDVPSCWGTYVTVDDVDATAKQVTELGGTVAVPPTDIPDVGRFAVIQDPQGAWLNIVTYKL